MRLTMKNPGGRNYRLACARESGALAFQAYRRIMLEVQILEEGKDAEGGVEPWASLGYAIQRWRKRK